jgi:hypothetical protein
VGKVLGSSHVNTLQQVFPILLILKQFNWVIMPVDEDEIRWIFNKFDIVITNTAIIQKKSNLTQYFRNYFDILKYRTS